VSRLGFRLVTAIHVAVYRAMRGRVAARIGKAPILLLTTRGRHSGKPRTVPLLFHADGVRVVVVASKGGAPHHPAWFLNLQAEPEVSVQIRGERRRLRAREADEAERAFYWPLIVSMYPAYERYQERTSRRIPLVVLKPA